MSILSNSFASPPEKVYATMHAEPANYLAEEEQTGYGIHQEAGSIYALRNPLRRNKTMSYVLRRLARSFHESFSQQEGKLAIHYPHYDKTKILYTFWEVAEQLTSLNPEHIRVDFVDLETISFRLKLGGIEITYDVYLFEEEEDLPGQEVIFLLYKNGEYICTGEGSLRGAFTKLLNQLAYNFTEEPRTVSPHELAINPFEHDSSISGAPYSQTRLS